MPSRDPLQRTSRATYCSERATPRAASELLCRVSSQLAPRDSPTASFSEAPVATAAASELVLGLTDARGRGGGHARCEPSEAADMAMGATTKVNHFVAQDRLQFYSASWTFKVWVIGTHSEPLSMLLSKLKLIV